MNQALIALASLLTCITAFIYSLTSGDPLIGLTVAVIASFTAVITTVTGGTRWP